MKEQIGMNLRRMRIRQGVSLRELARRLAISAPYLLDMEKGNRHYSMKYVVRTMELLKK